MRPRGVIVLVLKEGVTLGEIVDFSETLRYHRIVASSRFEISAPGIAKARPREVVTKRRRRYASPSGRAK